MVDIASGAALEPETSYNQKDPADVARGRLGGLKGCKARAEKLSPKDRQDQALLADRSRWKV